MVQWVGAVRVYLTSKLWLGAWLGAKKKDKKQGVRSKDNKPKLGYTLYHIHTSGGKFREAGKTF